MYHFKNLSYSRGRQNPHHHYNNDTGKQYCWHIFQSYLMNNGDADDELKSIPIYRESHSTWQTLIIEVQKNAPIFNKTIFIKTSSRQGHLVAIWLILGISVVLLFSVIKIINRDWGTPLFTDCQSSSVCMLTLLPFQLLLTVCC